jgi:hypothetical protein
VMHAFVCVCVRVCMHGLMWCMDAFDAWVDDCMHAWCRMDVCASCMGLCVHACMHRCMYLMHGLVGVCVHGNTSVGMHGFMCMWHLGRAGMGRMHACTHAWMWASVCMHMTIVYACVVMRTCAWDACMCPSAYILPSYLQVRSTLEELR